MAIVDDVTTAIRARSAGTTRPDLVRAGLVAFVRSLAAGWRAAAEYRQLNEMSERELRLRGLARDDIPRAIHQRHFASLPGWLDTND